MIFCIFLDEKSGSPLKRLGIHSSGEISVTVEARAQKNPCTPVKVSGSHPSIAEELRKSLNSSNSDRVNSGSRLLAE